MDEKEETSITVSSFILFLNASPLHSHNQFREISYQIKHTSKAI